MPRRPRLTRRTASAVAAVTAGAAGIAVQRRHLRALDRDPDYVRLRRPLGGRTLSATSPDGTVLHAEAFGPDTGHAIILAHGWTEQLSFWGPVIGRLSGRGQRVIAYDLRGHGASAPAAQGDYSLQRFGEDLEAVLAATVEAPQRATVVGHSLGAMSIAAWAGGHDVQARANGAVLVNTGLGDLIGGHLLFGELARWLNNPRLSRAVLGSAAPILPFSTPVSQALIRYMAFGPTASAGDVAFYERMLLACPCGVRAACGVVLSDLDLWPAVASLTVPTLVVTGERDRLTPPDHARRIVAALPAPAGLLELPATGHMSPLERPQELADAIEELVRRVAATPGVAAV
ncbi:MAG: alpha/beta fold hydrolase [Solirubrobacteraceae bacterium]